MVGVSIVPVNCDSFSTRPSSVPQVGAYVYVLIFASSIGGFLLGYDTGIVSSSMLYLPYNDDMKPMNSVWQEIIVSVTPGFAAISALFSGPSSDYFGRKKVIIVSSFIFFLGGVVCAAAVNKEILLTGRILLGIAIGFSSTIVPVYVGEASPFHIRGRLLTYFQVGITSGLLFANIFAGGFSYIDPENIGWRLMLGFAALPAAVQFFMFFFLPESPRWLMNHQRKEEAEEVLEKVYSGNKEWVGYEITEISNSLELIAKEMAGISGPQLLWKIFMTPHVRRALIVGCLLQMFQQCSGINTIMYYTGKIIQSAGVSNTHNVIWISVGVAGINWACTFIPLYIIERYGKRMLLLTSSIGVAITLALLGGAFLLINKQSIDSFSPFLNITSAERSHCFQLSNCDSCVTDENCGFCQITSTGGYCLPSMDGLQFGPGPCENSSSTDMFANGSNQFFYGFCYSKYTALPIVLILAYLCFYSIGYGPLPWVMNAEFYPLAYRGVCVSISTFVNWSFNLLISLTFLTLTQAITKYGTYFLYCGVTCVAIFFAIFFVPETKGTTIEEVELLFMNKKERKQKLAELQAEKREAGLH